MEESDDSLEDQSDVSPTEDVIIDQSNTSTHIVNEEVVEQPFPTLSAQSMQDELEKSHAVKHQTGSVVITQLMTGVPSSSHRAVG